MRFLLVGGGAREHAMGGALTRHGDVELVVVSKHKNPGLAKLAKVYEAADESSVDAVLKVATKHRPDYAVIGPEAPLAAGVSDALRRANVPVAAPSKAAAEIETSKRFMRDLLTRHGLPGNIRSQVFDSADAARKALREDLRVALKPIGLTGGKGVRVFGDHFTDLDGAAAYIDEVFRDHIGGEGILVEERLEGEEFTIQCLSDGRRVVPTMAVQDHKRLLEGDAGPNTGGMGSYSQADGLLPFLDRKGLEAAIGIVSKIVGALAKEGRAYVGPIYGQFMLTREGPKVVEVNARFGDPEAMNVFALLETPYADIAKRMAEQRLSGADPRFARLATVVKYVVPEGYGSNPVKGVPLEIDVKALERSQADLYFANVEETRPNGYVCGTGRAVAVLGKGETIHAANEVCEAGLKAVKATQIHVRHDIGTTALLERRVRHMKAIRGP